MVLVVAGTILAYVFVIGVQQGFNTNPTGVTAVIIPTLYSTEAKVGLYGAPSNITIILSNTLTTLQRGFINVTSNSRVVQSVPFLLLASQTLNTVVSQRLNATGVWAVTVTTRGVNVNSYTFQVVATKDEADFAVGQWRDQTFYRNLVLASFILSITSLIVAAASLARKPKTIIQ